MIDSIQIHYHEHINYQAAHKACAALSHNRLDHEQLAYHQLPTYFCRLHQYNLYVYTHLETVPGINDINNLPTSRFHHVFICPAEA